MGAPEYRGTVCRWTLDKVSSSTIESHRAHTDDLRSSTLLFRRALLFLFLFLFPTFLIFLSVSPFFFFFSYYISFRFHYIFSCFIDHQLKHEVIQVSISQLLLYIEAQKVKRCICISTKIITSHGQQDESSSCYVKSLRDSSETNGKVVARTLLRFCLCFENRSSTFFSTLCRFFLEYLIR